MLRTINRSLSSIYRIGKFCWGLAVASIVFLGFSPAIHYFATSRLKVDDQYLRPSSRRLVLGTITERTARWCRSFEQTSRHAWHAPLTKDVLQLAVFCPVPRP